MQVSELKKLFKTHGSRTGVQVLREALELDEGSHKLRPEDFNFTEIWEEFYGPVRVSLGESGAGYIRLSEDAVDSSAFADIVGVLISQKVIEGYNTPGYIGDRLVTRVGSNRKTERYAGFTAIDGPREVAEGMPYQETGFTSKYATSEATKKGRLINITEETIKFDQTGQVLMRASALGEKCRLDKERVIIRGVADTDDSVFSPQGSAEAIYRTAAGTNSSTVNKVTGNALVDWTDIDNAMQLFAEMTDDRGDEIVVSPKVLLLPWALSATGNRIVNATEVRHANGDITTISGNPITGLSLLSTPLLDSVSKTQWYLGDPAKQFIWHEIWPLQVTRKRLEQDAHIRDIVASFKVRYFGGIAAIDDKYQVQSDE